MPAGGSLRRSPPYLAAVAPSPAAVSHGSALDGLRFAEAVAFGALVIVLAAIIGTVAPDASVSASGTSVPTLAISPTGGPAGARATVSGSGYGHVVVQLLWDGSADGMPAVQANGAGAFNATMVVPSAAAVGTHTITGVAITGSGRGNGAKQPPGSSSVSFSVLQLVGSPAPTATPTPTHSAIASATPLPTATPAPTTTAPPSAAATAAPSSPASTTPVPSASAASTPAASGFVTRCGTSLCVNGAPWYLYGAAGRDVAAARAAHLNTIRITNWLHEEPGSDPYEESRWVIVDGVLAQARSAGMRAILDLSTYRNYLYNSGLDPYVLDWAKFVTFVATRTNTVNGIPYKDDPTIALVGFAGEVDGINGNSDKRSPTTAQLNAFYERTFGEWRAIDGRHLLEPGGLLHFAWDSGIDWRTIFSYSDVCAIHNYSQDDTNATPAVAAYCASLGKPWITEEFGWSQTVGDSTRAQDFAGMYALQRANRAAGVSLWYLGPQLLGVNGVADTYDVNPQTPLVWNAVLANAP